MAAPVVTPINAFVQLNQSILASTLFSAVDPDGDTITQYRFRDLSSIASTGFLRYNGVALNNGAQTTVAAGDLSKLSFVSGSVVGNEQMQIEAFANGQWSAVSLASIYFVRNNVTPPVVTVSNPTVLQDETITLSSFISAMDPDGYLIEKFYLRDQVAGASSGNLLLNGTAVAQGTWRYYTPSEFNGLQYFAFNAVENERLEVFAYDGAQWSAYKFAVPNVRANINAPTTFYADKTVRTNTSTFISSSLGWSDSDGNTIKWVEFFDTNSAGTSGNLERNGTLLAPGQWHRVSTADLATVRFVGGSAQGDDYVKYRVFDGRHLSNASDFRLRTVVQPVLLNSTFHQTSLWNLQATPFIIRGDQGPTYTQFQVVDLTNTTTSGFFRLGNNALASGQIHTVSASQLGQLTFRTGRPEFRSLDSVAVRAFNGTYWGAWTKHDIRTEPNYRHALKALDNPTNLLSVEGNDWNDWLPLAGAPTNRLSYSFRENWDGNGFDGSNVDNFSRFTPAQISMAREAFRQVSEFTNLQFEEIADVALNEIGGDGGVIRMSNYANPDGEAAAYAQFPGLATLSGDIKMNVAFTSTSLAGTRPGTSTFEIFIHEFGHALGHKHPHEGAPKLSTSNDNPLFTVMSYVPNPARAGNNYNGLYDLVSLQDYYGANMTTRAGDDLYDINGFFGGDANWTGAIWDGGGNDTLSAVGAPLGAIIDITQGGQSSLGSTFNPFTGQTVLTRDHVGIAFNVDIENVIGSALGDVINGNTLANVIDAGAGDDVIRAGGGNDLITGGAGSDVIFWGVGEGNDNIDERGLAGRDRLDLINFPNMNDFTEDLSFRRLGLDLVLEIALDNGEAESTMRIKNQAWGGFRIETLRFNGVDVDLNSIYSQTTAVSRRFALSSTSSLFGALANPVV